MNAATYIDIILLVITLASLFLVGLVAVRATAAMREIATESHHTTTATIVRAIEALQLAIERMDRAAHTERVLFSENSGAARPARGDDLIGRSAVGSGVGIDG